MLRAAHIALLVSLVAGLSPAAHAQFASDAPPTRIGVEPAIVATPEAKSGGQADLTATWSGPSQWLEGVPFAGSAFGGGAFYGRNWFSGSSIEASGDVPVEIVFDRGMSSAARVFRRESGYTNAGVGTFDGAAYDISDPDAPRRLNVAFVEDDRLCGGADSRWSPAVDPTGCREYLYIMASDYDGDGSTYADATPYSASFDLLYAIAARVPSGRSLFESQPVSLTLSFPPLRFLAATTVDNGRVQLSAFYTPPAALASGARLAFTFAPDGGTPQDVGTSYDAESTSFEALASVDGLDPSRVYAFQAVLRDASGTPLYESAAVQLKPVISRGATLVGVWNERGSYADVWGYTAPDGREYALVALQNFGLSVIDITGSTPVEVGFVPTASGASDSKDVKVVGSHAYLVNENGPIQIISLADPSNPVQVGLLDVQVGISGSGSHNVSVDGDRLYVTGGRTSGNAGLRIYSTATPEAPELIGEYRPNHFNTPYYHDFYVDGTTGYGPNIYGGGVDILDLSDPASPQRISTFGYPGSGAHNVCGTTDGRYVFVGDEIGSAGNWTRVFDVSDPLDAEFVTEIIVDNQAVVHNCYVTGDLLHIGHYTEGYRVFDVSDPTAPIEVALYDTFQGSGYGYNGVWSIYPYFPSGRVAVSDRQGGLFVIELDANITDAEPPVPTSALEITAGPNPASGAVQIRAALDAPGPARLSLLDARGREVAVLHEGEASGAITATLDATALAPGLYVVRLSAGGQLVTRTITVVR